MTTYAKSGMLWVLATVVGLLALAASATQNDVTWSGGSTPFDPSWAVDANWAGNAAPDTSTTGKIYFDAEGQAVQGQLETDRTVGGVFETGTAERTHTINLGGNTLTVAGDWDMQLSMGTSSTPLNSTMILTNGTLRLGNDTTAGRLLVGVGAHTAKTLRFRSDTSLDTYNCTLFDVGRTSGSHRDRIIDLRDASVARRSFEVDTLRLRARARILLAETKAFDTLIVRDYLDFHVRGDSYIGVLADKRLPADVDITIGVNADTPGRLRLSAEIATSTALLLARSGGTFTAWLSTMIIGENNIATGGTLDIVDMNACAIEAATVTLGRGSVGTLMLPPGTFTAGTVSMGERVVDSFGTVNLDLRETHMVVTNALTVDCNANWTLRVGAEPGGLAATNAVTFGPDLNLSINAQFLEEPNHAGTHYALKLAGNHMAVLASVGAAGKLTMSSSVAGMKPTVFYDGDFTYIALIDEDEDVLPYVEGTDAAFERQQAGSVLVGLDDVLAGAFDFEGRDYEILLSHGDESPLEILQFDADGDYTVTLTIRIVGSDPVIQSTDTCTVWVTPIEAAVETDVIWSGGASTALMSRPEWFWGANWAGGAPPAVTTPGIIYFDSTGQSIAGLLETDRTVGGVFETGEGSRTHTLNLGGHTLTIAGDWDQQRASSTASTYILTNGVLRLGNDEKAGRLLSGVGSSDTRKELRLRSGATLDTYNCTLFDIGRTSHTHADRIVDLRETAVVGRIFEVGTLLLRARSRLVLDADNAGLDEIRVRTALDIRRRGVTYLGHTDEILPAGVNVTVGVDAGNTATLALNSELNEAGNHSQLIARSGGTFTAWLSTMHIGTASFDYGGTLDIAAMDACAIVADTVRIGTVRRGTAKLPPGTFQARDTQIGGGTSGLLELNGTLMTVGETLTISAAGELVVRVGATPAGIALDAGAELTLAEGGRRILVQFDGVPADPHVVHYGIRLVGDQVEALDTFVQDGRIDYEPASGVVDGRHLEVFLYRGHTYFGLAPLPRGSLLLLR